MSPISYSPRAMADLYRIHAFLNTKDKNAAMRAAKAIKETIALLKIQPKIGKPKENGYREIKIKFGKSGYIALYRIHGDVVVITAIKHQKEKGYQSILNPPHLLITNN